MRRTPHIKNDSTLFLSFVKRIADVNQRGGIQTERLRSWREKRGLSQRELARLSGIGEAQVSKYENGNVDPSATYLKKMAEVLQVSADYLLGLSDDPKGQLGANEMNNDERDLLDKFRRDGWSGVAHLLGDQLAK